jgi:hypothetical protein
MAIGGTGHQPQIFTLLNAVDGDLCRAPHAGQVNDRDQDFTAHL